MEEILQFHLYAFEACTISAIAIVVINRIHFEAILQIRDQRAPNLYANFMILSYSNIIALLISFIQLL